MYKKRTYLIDLQPFRRKGDNCPMVAVKMTTPLGIVTLYVEFYELFARVMYARSRRKSDQIILCQQEHNTLERVVCFDVSPEFADMVIISMLNLREKIAQEDDKTKRLTDFDIDDAFDNLLN